MMLQVLADEAGDEVVAVVVARLHPQRQRMTCQLAARAKLRLELGGKEFVGIALIDQQRQLLRQPRQSTRWHPIRASCDGLLPSSAEKAFCAPRAINRIADRRERRHAAITPRIAQRADQRAVAAHRMTGDAALVRAGKCASTSAGNSCDT